MMTRLASLPLTLAVMACGSQSAGSRLANAPTVAGQARDALTRDCVACHGTTPVGDHNKLNNINDLGLLASGPAVKPGQPQLSKIWRRMTSTAAPMPPLFDPTTGAAIPRPAAADLAAITAWISAGAPAQ